MDRAKYGALRHTRGDGSSAGVSTIYSHELGAVM